MSQPADDVYPNINHLPRQSSSSHSNGSFGPVFAILAVIIVLSAVACVLGRLCNSRYHRDAATEEAGHHSSKGKKQSHGLGPREWESRQEPGDVEFGFDKKIPSVQMSQNRGGKEKHAHRVHGGHKAQVRFADHM